jgi:alpha-glucosidase (family GH31 glycosyl hydrolase)
MSRRQSAALALATATALLTGATAVPAARAAPVVAGPLSARAGGGAFGVTLAQRGGPTLRLTGLALRTATGWAPATRVMARRRDGRALRLRVATGDPAGRGLAVLMAPHGDGAIAISAVATGTGARAGEPSALRATFAAPAGERYYGFGERADAVDHRGRDVESYVSDGPFSAASRPVTSATIPPWGFRARDDATYYPVPWLLSSRGYGVLADGGATSTFHLGTAARRSWDVEVAAPSLKLRVFAGPTPAGALARFTEATGRQPAAPAAWAYGPWLQTGQPNAPPLADQMADLAKLRRADAPVSAAETQLRYLPCGLDRGLEGYEAQRVAFYHRHGLAVLTYVNPMLCASYDPLHREALAAGALQGTASGAPAQFDAFVGGTGAAGFTVQPVGQFDFSRPAGSALYARVLRRIAATGHDGWMEDFGEYTPPDAVDAHGRTGSALHNSYPVSYHCAAARIARGLPRPIVRFQRSGWTGAARCAVDVWGGDPTTTFGFDGLSSAVKSALGMGLSGVSRWGSDIGGYDTIGADPRLTPELLQRWIEFGAVSGVMRIKKSGLAIPAYERPQVTDPGIIATWRRYTKLHTALYPYLAAADATYRRTGLPLMRALVLDDPRDPRAAAADDEFRLGRDLLAAPVLSAGARSRAVYLPRGRWLEARRSLSYDAAGDGALHLARAVAVRGGRTVRARAGVGELPLYVRAGAILPLLPSDVSTLSPYGKGHVVRLADRRGALRLLAFPRGRSSAGMFATERLASRAGRGRWSLAVRGARTRRYALEASTADLRDARGGAFRPCRLRVGARTLPRGDWRFDAGRRVLTASFRARRATLQVTACR